MTYLQSLAAISIVEIGSNKKNWILLYETVGRRYAPENDRSREFMRQLLGTSPPIGTQRDVTVAD